MRQRLCMAIGQIFRQSIPIAGKRGNESAVRKRSEHDKDIIKLGQTLLTPIGLMPRIPQSTCMPEWKAQSTTKDTL